MTEAEQIVHLIPHQQVRPDPDQPRRLLPANLVQALAAGGEPLDILARRTNTNRSCRTRSNVRRVEHARFAALEE